MVVRGEGRVSGLEVPAGWRLKGVFMGVWKLVL
jgi:hypothetical protein